MVVGAQLSDQGMIMSKVYQGKEDGIGMDGW
jgi:hypothetical protein